MQRKCLTSVRSSIQLFCVVFIIYALVYMTKNCYSAALASIVDEGIMTKSQTGLISAVFYIIYATFQIIGGVAADRYSCRNLIVLGVFGAAVCNLLIYFADSYMEMLMIWSFNGLIQFGVWPAIFKIVTTQLVPQVRTKAIFYITLAATVGLLFSYVCAMFVGAWKNNFLLSAIVLFLSAAVFYFVYTKYDKEMVVEEEKEEKKDEKQVEYKAHVLPLILKAGIPFLLIVNIIQNMLNLGIKALTPVMLTESYSWITPTIANGFNLVLIIAAPIGMYLSKSKFFDKFSYTGTIALFLGLSVPLLVVTAFIGKIHAGFILAALFILMILLAASGLFFHYIAFSFGKFGYTATISGMFNCAASLGVVLSNYVFAMLADMFGWTITTRWWVVLLVSALLLTLISMPTWKRFLKWVEKL